MENQEPEKKRKVMLVIEDVGDDKFSFTLQGDVERLSQAQIPASLLSPAEFWGAEFFKLCANRLNQGDTKRLNREERRRG